jgi:hypothetical protein
VKSAARRESMRVAGPEKSLVTPKELYEFSRNKFAPKYSSTNITKSDSTQQQKGDAKIHIWYLSETEIKQHFEKYLSRRCDARSSTGPIHGKKNFYFSKKI